MFLTSFLRYCRASFHWSTALVFVALWLVSVWNPYGILDYTADRSSQIAIKTLAHTYPKNAQPEYIVVLLQDDLRAKQKEENFEWPVSTDMHARLLGKLNALNPSMIFSDIIYTRTAKIECVTRPNCTGRLAQAFKRINRKEIPFYIAKGEIVEGADWLNEQPTLPTNWNVENNTMPLINMDNDAHYPLFQMYRLWCQNKKGKAVEGCSDLYTTDIKKRFGAPLIIRWGKEDTIAATDGIMSRYRARLNAVKFGFSDGIDEHSELSIPWISAADVVWPNARMSEKLEDLISGKVVFIGLNIEGLGDKIYNPITGYVPAVFSHAMGFDNLVQFKDNYWRDANINSTRWPFLNQLIQQVPTIFSIFIVFAAFKYFEYKTANDQAEQSRKILTFSLIALVIIPILLLLWEITTQSLNIDWFVFLAFLLLLYSLILSSIWLAIYMCLNIARRNRIEHFKLQYKNGITYSLFLAGIIYVSSLFIGLLWWYLIEQMQYPSYNIVAVSVSAIWLMLNSIVEIVISD